MDVYENEISPDDWLVSDVNADRDDDPVAYERKLRKKYDTVKRDVNAIDGLSIKAPDWATLIATKKRDDDHPLVSESDFKTWSRKNPKKPTVYKTYEELARKSKADTEAFRTWAKTSSPGKKVLEEWGRSEKLKPADAARVKALKMLDALLAGYYKTF